MPPEPNLLAPYPPPAEYWTAQERWIWDRSLRGELADLNVRYQEAEPLDPKQDDARWSDANKPRLVSEQFLLDVLGDKRYREAIPLRGLSIVGARFDSDLDLRSLHTEHCVSLDYSRFERTVRLVNARFETRLSLEGSAFNEVLNMNGLTVGHDLLLSGGARFVGGVKLVGAKVDGTLDASGATFEAGLNMVDLKVGESLVLSDGARFAGEVYLGDAQVDGHLDARGATFVGAVRLGGAKVDGTLDASGATFEAGLNMVDLRVGQDIWLSDGARFAGEVYLGAAKVDRTLDASGASFEAGLNMNGLRVGQDVWLSDGARFAGEVELAGGAKIEGWLHASGATFEAGLNMNGLRVGQCVALSGGTHFAGEVYLGGAKVAGHLDAHGSTFEAGLIMNHLTVGESLLLSGSARFVGEVKLLGARVEGSLHASGATFEANLYMRHLTIGQRLLLNAGARFAGNVDLGSAKVDGTLDATGATFEAGLIMEGLTAEHLLLNRAVFAGKVSLVFAEVGAINLGGATFRAPVDASGLSAKGELTLTPPPTWADRARFVLRNAHVGTLNDGGDPTSGVVKQNPWPKRGGLELDGFTYGRLGGRVADSTTELRPRQARWYINDWLARDTSYTPQPYQQLAGVLRANGDPSAANAVLFAARQRERSEAWKAKAWPRWLGLWLLRWTIGYGLGWRYFLVLIPIGLFTLGGAIILWTSGADKLPPAAIARVVGPAGPESKLDEAEPAAQERVLSDLNQASPQAEPEDRHGFGWCLWASFDWMVPFIELDEYSTEAVARLQGGPGYLLYFQALAGYVLAGFLAAGLAGLTQSRG